MKNLIKFVIGISLVLYSLPLAANANETYFLGDVNGDGYKDVIEIKYGIARIALGSENEFVTYMSFMDAKTYFYYSWKKVAKFHKNDRNASYFAISGNHAYVVPGNNQGVFDHSQRKYMNSGYFNYSWKELADVNGDGYLDFIGMSGSHAYVVPGTSQRVFDHSQRKYMNCSYFNYPWKKIADVNGDGYMDFIAISGNHAYVVPGNSQGYFDYTKRKYMNCGYFNYPWKRIADVNGDGYMDFIAISGEHAYVVPGNSQGYFDYSKRRYMKSHMFNYQWKEIADVDGNGKADIIMRQGQDIFIRRGNSNGLFDDYKWPSDWKKSPLLVPYWKFDDMNGDGKIDFLGKETGRMFIIPSDGNAWYKYCNNTVQLVIF